MTITYNKTYKLILEGNGWELLSDVNPKDSLIVHDLFELVKKSKAMTFEQLEGVLREAKNSSIRKSSCTIYFDEATIEICTRGTFPRFYILKTEVKQESFQHSLSRVLDLGDDVSFGVGNKPNHKLHVGGINKLEDAR